MPHPRPLIFALALALFLTSVPAPNPAPAQPQGPACPEEILQILDACAKVGGCVVIPRADFEKLVRGLGRNA